MQNIYALHITINNYSVIGGKNIMSNVTIRDPLIPHNINTETYDNGGFIKNELGIAFPVGEGYPVFKKANTDWPTDQSDFDDIKLSQSLATINHPGAVNKLDGNADSYLGGDGEFHTSEYLEKLTATKVELRFQAQLDALRALNEEKSHRIYGIDIDLNNSDPYSELHIQMMQLGLFLCTMRIHLIVLFLDNALL